VPPPVPKRLGAGVDFLAIRGAILSIHPVNPQHRLIRQAAAIVRAGGVDAYPTDSSYALGCRVGDIAAVQRIRELRGVDASHHLTLMCRDLAEIGRYAQLDNWHFRIVKQDTRELHFRCRRLAKFRAGSSIQTKYDRRRVADRGRRRCSRSWASRCCPRRSFLQAQVIR
jgi:hypothetical protein